MCTYDSLLFCNNNNNLLRRSHIRELYILLGVKPLKLNKCNNNKWNIACLKRESDTGRRATTLRLSPWLPLLVPDNQQGGSAKTHPGRHENSQRSLELGHISDDIGPLLQPRRRARLLSANQWNGDLGIILALGRNVCLKIHMWIVCMYQSCKISVPCYMNILYLKENKPRL